jgi:serine/threonine-protein kinase
VRLANTGPVAARATVRPAPAWLDVDSVPTGCQVRLDQAALADHTPLRRMPLDSDQEIRVTVLCADHEPDSKMVLARPGEHVQLEFRPAPSAPPREPTQPKRRPGRGMLRLNSNPWTEVYWKGKRMGVTPLLDARLPVGTHEITLINPESGQRKTIQIRIRPGRTTTQFVHL